MTEPLFNKVLRGYDTSEVDTVTAAAEAALRSDSPPAKADAIATLRLTSFTVVMRGYDRGQVDRYLESLLAELVAS